jgi:transposase-like protein
MLSHIVRRQYTLEVWNIPFRALCKKPHYRFPLSYRDVQELLFERGIDVSHEAIRQWCGKFGQEYANQFRRHRPRPGDKWHMEMCQTPTLVIIFGVCASLDEGR